MFDDPNTNCVINAGETVLQQHAALATGYTLRENAIDCVTYNATGLITPAALHTWSLCDPTRDPQFQRAIDLTVTGRVSLLAPAQIAAQAVPAPCP